MKYETRLLLPRLRRFFARPTFSIPAILRFPPRVSFRGARELLAPARADLLDSTTRNCYSSSFSSVRTREYWPFRKDGKEKTEDLDAQELKIGMKLTRNANLIPRGTDGTGGYTRAKNFRFRIRPVIRPITGVERPRGLITGCITQHAPTFRG